MRFWVIIEGQVGTYVKIHSASKETRQSYLKKIELMKRRIQNYKANPTDRFGFVTSISYYFCHILDDEEQV